MPNNPGTNAYQNLRDQNRIPVASGQSNTDSTQSLPFLIDSVTGRLLISGGGGSGNNFVYNEIVAGSGTTFTLAHNPVAGLYSIYAQGQLLLPLGVDYTISGAVITTVNTWVASDITASYQY